MAFGSHEYILHPQLTNVNKNITFSWHFLKLWITRRALRRGEERRRRRFRRFFRRSCSTNWLCLETEATSGEHCQRFLKDGFSMHYIIRISFGLSIDYLDLLSWNRKFMHHLTTTEKPITRQHKLETSTLWKKWRGSGDDGDGDLSRSWGQRQYQNCDNDDCGDDVIVVDDDDDDNDHDDDGDGDESRSWGQRRDQRWWRVSRVGGHGAVSATNVIVLNQKTTNQPYR